MIDKVKEVKFSLMDDKIFEVEYNGEEALEDMLSKSIKNQIILRLLLDIAKQYKNEGMTKDSYVSRLSNYIIFNMNKIANDVFK